MDLMDDCLLGDTEIDVSNAETGHEALVSGFGGHDMEALILVNEAMALGELEMVKDRKSGKKR